MLEPRVTEKNVKLLGEAMVSLHEQAPCESMVTLFWLAVAMDNREEGCVEAGVMMDSNVSLRVEPAATSTVGWTDTTDDVRGRERGDRGIAVREGIKTRVYVVIVE